MSVVAIVPAHDEALRIRETVVAARSVTAIDRVIVVDDGSADGTADLARSAGAEVVSLEKNSGKGRALETGLSLLEDEVRVAVFLDADLGETASQADLLIEPVLSGEVDMAVGTLPSPPASGGFGLVKGLARWGVHRLCGYRAHQPLSGQRALTRAAWTTALPFPPGFGIEVALTVRVVRSGLVVREVPTTMTHAATGRDLAGFVHRGRQFIAVVAALARLAAERQSAGDSAG